MVYQQLPSTLVDPPPGATLPQAFVEHDHLRLVYIHGILNKPVLKVLKCQWDQAIFEQEVEAARFAYWVNRRRHPDPVKEDCSYPDRTQGILAPDLEPSFLEDHPAARIEAEIAALGATPAEQAFLTELAAEMLVRTAAQAGWTPDPLGFLTRQITRAFIPDAHDFLFNRERRYEIERIFADALGDDAGQVIVVAHSMGTIIAYEVLRKLQRQRLRVPLFLTLGSPLGLFAVEHVLRGWSGASGKLPRPSWIERWVNVYDRHDPISADPDLADDYEGAIEDVEIVNLGPDAHSATGYLQSHPVREAIRAITSGAAQAAV